MKIILLSLLIVCSAFISKANNYGDSILIKRLDKNIVSIEKIGIDSPKFEIWVYPYLKANIQPKFISLSNKIDISGFPNGEYIIQFKEINDDILVGEDYKIIYIQN